MKNGLSRERSNIDIFNQFARFFCTASVLGKATIVVTLLGAVYLIGYWIWYLILVIYYKNMD